MPSKKYSEAGADRESLILKAALLYYKGGLTQDEIARRLGFSRPTVVRMLQKAREIGLVEIRITKKIPQTIDYETQLESALNSAGLKQAMVVEQIGGDAQDTVAAAAAVYLRERLRSSDVLGVAWSHTLRTLPAHLQDGTQTPTRIVQMGGHAGSTGSSNAQEIALRLGDFLGATVELVPAPVIVSSKAMRDELHKDPVIRETRKWVARINVGLVGVGVMGKDSRLVQARYLKSSDLIPLARKGAIGEILGHYYDIYGNSIDTPWSDRTLTVSLERFKAIDNLVAVATGADKAESMLGAIRAGLANTVVIDTALADALLEVRSARNLPKVRAV